VLALVLWLVFGWRYGAAEVLFELAVCAAIWGGGGGRRVRRTWRELTRRRFRLAPHAAGTSCSSSRRPSSSAPAGACATPFV
jgi:hypothetical protein